MPVVACSGLSFDMPNNLQATAAIFTDNLIYTIIFATNLIQTIALLPYFKNKLETKLKIYQNGLALLNLIYLVSITLIFLSKRG